MAEGVSYPPMDLSAFAKSSDITAAAASNLTAMQALIPALGNTAPPPVALAGAPGSGNATSRWDHTHESSVQRNRISVPLTAGLATVPFVKNYTAAPVVVATAETPSSVTDGVYMATVVKDSVTTTGFQVQVVKVVKSVTLPSLATSLLGLVINVFTAATGSVTVDYVAAPATV